MSSPLTRVLDAHLSLMADAFDLVFYENRSTPQVVARGKTAKSKPSWGKRKSRRAATEAETKVIKRGDWVRVNASGKKPDDAGYQRGSKIRPQLRPK